MQWWCSVFITLTFGLYPKDVFYEEQFVPELVCLSSVKQNYRISDHRPRCRITVYLTNST